MPQNKILTHTFTGTTDANGFLVVPFEVVNRNTGLIIGIRGDGTTNSCFHLVYSDSVGGGRFTIRLLAWDFGNSYGNVSKTVTIAYILF